MANQIIVIGLNPAGKVPAALFNVNFGVGLQSVGSIPRFCLLTGNKLSSGSVTPDTQVVDITANSDLNALFGFRSEIVQQILAARQYPGVRIKAICVAEAAGGASATATITFAGTATSSGTWTYYVAGVPINVTVATGDTPTVQAANAVIAFGNNPTIPVTAANIAGVVTLTVANKGVRGNDWTLMQDITQGPATTTSAIASASGYTVTSPSGGVTGVRFGGGTGQDSVTNALATLAGTAYFTIGAAQNDAGTNAPLWKAYNVAKAAIGSQLFEHICFGQNGLYSTAATLSTALNLPRMQIAWHRGGEDNPAVIAASLAALRTQYDQVHPNQRFDGVQLLGLHPQRAVADRPSPGETGEQEIALENGVTPVTSTSDGKAIIVRGVTTLSTRSGSAFYGCIDTGQARTPDVAAEALLLAWQTDFAVNNQWVNSDPLPNEKARPTGVATPSTWSAYAFNLLGAQINNSWFSSVAVASQFDSATNQILTQIDLQVTPQNHRVAGNVNQTS